MGHKEHLKETEAKLRELLVGKTVTGVEIPTSGNDYGEIKLITATGTVSVGFDVGEDWLVGFEGAE